MGTTNRSRTPPPPISHLPPPPPPRSPVQPTRSLPPSSSQPGHPVSQQSPQPQQSLPPPSSRTTQQNGLKKNEFNKNKYQLPLFIFLQLLNQLGTNLRLCLLGKSLNWLN